MALRTRIILQQYQLACSNAVDHDEMLLLFARKVDIQLEFGVLSVNTYICINMMKDRNVSQFIVQFQVCANLGGGLASNLCCCPLQAVLLTLNFLFV